MIKITHKNGCITIDGHAGYAPTGQDIVCAGVSTLAQTLIEAIERLTEDEISYVISPGTVDIEYRNLSAGAQLLVDSFFIGVQMIANEYPANVRIEDRQTDKKTNR